MAGTVTGSLCSLHSQMLQNTRARLVPISYRSRAKYQTPNKFSEIQIFEFLNISKFLNFRNSKAARSLARDL